MIGNDVKLIEYSKKVDTANCITHAAGAVMAAAALVIMLSRAGSLGMRHILSTLIFGLSMITVYTFSAVYHGLPAGESKRVARLIDHSAIPILIAGTSTPCAMITIYNVSPPHCTAIMIIAWFCALFGVVSKLFFFQKLRVATMVVYITSCAVMLLSVVPLIGELDPLAFGGILLGCVTYVIGAVFCGLGIKREKLHIVFHIFVILANAIHVFVILKYMVS
jgi:hemolysin III